MNYSTEILCAGIFRWKSIISGTKIKFYVRLKIRVLIFLTTVTTRNRHLNEITIAEYQHLNPLLMKTSRNKRTWESGTSEFLERCPMCYGALNRLEVVPTTWNCPIKVFRKPQGSVLGPLLLVLYINDIQIHQFADDTIIFLQFSISRLSC